MSNPVRHTLGIIALVLVAVGGYLTFSGDRTTGGIFLRVGVMAAAAWLVVPLMRRPSLATVALLAAGVLILVRPRLLFPAVVGAVIWRVGRRRRSADRT